MNDDLMIMARASELIRAGAAKAKTRKLIALIVAISFAFGFAVGATMPFQITAVPVQPVHAH